MQHRKRMMLLSFLATLLVAAPAWGHSVCTVEDRAPDSAAVSASYCEDFAKRQVQLADRILEKSNYSRALKVLNSTARDCNIDFVRQKLVEVYRQWLATVRESGSTSEFRNYIQTLSSQSYITSGQRSRLNSRVRSHVLSDVKQNFRVGQYRGAYRVCRTYPAYAGETFEGEYFCGRAADEIGATDAAMSSYAWLLDNWVEDQNLASWEEISSTLEQLYFRNGRFEAAYGLAQQNAARNPSPETILASLTSVRGHFLAPLLHASSQFYGSDPSEKAQSYIDEEMQRVNFPRYVQAFYILQSDGTVERGMYGTEADQPSASLLDQASEPASLLTNDDRENLAWLVSPVGPRYLVLEFNLATTAEENVRLESVLQDVENDTLWQKLYELEFTETSPATGSAIGTILSGTSIDEGDFGPYDALFDDSQVLSYYCIQNAGEEIEQSHNFNRADLGYENEAWERSSNTPALYHHSVQYNGQPIREVVWPKFVDEKWTGVVRVGLAHS